MPKQKKFKTIQGFLHVENPKDFTKKAIRII